MNPLPEIKPFRGIFYNRTKIGDLADVVTPPYDVISPEERDAYYEASDYNVIRLILGKTLPGDNPSENKYTRAAHYFKEWREQGILSTAEKPAVYIYENAYKINNQEIKRIGFIALLKLEDFESGKVLPHEKTFPKTRMDRLNLIRACKANFSQIFSLYSDPERKIDQILKSQAKNESPAIGGVVDKNGVKHTIRAILDEKTIANIAWLMRNKTIFIADGHHRYETALNFRNEMRERLRSCSGEEPFNYVMMMFVNMDGEGLTILPVHRVLKDLPEVDEERFAQRASEFFGIEMLDFGQDGGKGKEDQKIVMQQRLARGSGKSHIFGAYLGTNRYHLLTLRYEDMMDRILPNEHSREWKRLDVTILHALLIDYVLETKSKNLIKHNCIKFTPDINEATSLVDKGEYQIAFFVNPTKVEEIKAVASHHEKMPPKSTYFYPKLLTGLVMNKLER
ncbi:MAG: DUF1015 domain-containing protein [Actinomycetota bacterium]|nr:DUF1015 domain-containing protein [Actinomycetota bacterium]